MNWIILKLLLLQIFFSTIILSQSIDYSNKRSVIINCGDSIIYAYIYTGSHKIKQFEGRPYYWVHSNKIHNNSGGYSGSLLIDGYMVMDKEKNMIEKGSFEYGLKTGQWKRWYQDGKIRCVCFYKKGLLDGTMEVYPDSGDFFTRIHYNNGKEERRSRIAINDSPINLSIREKMLKEDPHKKVRKALNATPSDSLK